VFDNQSTKKFATISSRWLRTSTLYRPSSMSSRFRTSYFARYRTAEGITSTGLRSEGNATRDEGPEWSGPS
jgi:hypothetical protein